MTNETITLPTDATRAVSVSDLSDAQHSAVLLHGLLEGTSFLDNEGQKNSRTATLEVAVGLAGRPVDELFSLEARKQ